MPVGVNWFYEHNKAGLKRLKNNLVTDMEHLCSNSEYFLATKKLKSNVDFVKC